MFLFFPGLINKFTEQLQAKMNLFFEEILLFAVVSQKIGCTILIGIGYCFF